MRLTTILPVLTLFISIGCSKEKAPDVDNVLHLEDALYKDHPGFLENFGTVTIQPLVTSDSCLLTDDAVIRYAGPAGYIVTDRKGIYRFAPDGSFLNPIGRIGNGPGEYVGTRCVTVNPDTERIYAWEERGVLEFDFEGSHLATLPLAIGSAYQGFGVSFGDSLFAFERQHYGPHGLVCRMIYADRAGREKDSVEFYNDTVRVDLVLPGAIWFWRNDNRWLHREAWGMDVNEITHNGVERLFTMDFGPLTQTRAIYQDAKLRVHKTDYVQCVGEHLFLSAQHLWLDAWWKKNRFLIIYNLKKNEIEFCKSFDKTPERERGIPCRAYSHLNFWPSFVDQEGNALMLLHPDLLKPEDIRRLQNQFPAFEISEENNPLIIKLTLLTH